MRTIGLTFEGKQKTIEPPFDYSGTEDVVDLKSMTVAELKAYAAELGINIGSASRKDEIIQAITAAGDTEV